MVEAEGKLLNVCIAKLVEKSRLCQGISRISLYAFFSLPVFVVKNHIHIFVLQSFAYKMNNLKLSKLCKLSPLTTLHPGHVSLPIAWVSKIITCVFTMFVVQDIRKLVCSG